MLAPKIFTFLLALVITLGFNSCSHYSIIHVNETPFKSVYVNTISNQDFAPNVHTLFQNQIRQTILRDGRLTLSNKPEDADTSLYITIKDYKRNVNTRSSVDAGRYNSLKIGLAVFVSLYDNETNTYLVKNVHLGSNEYLFFDPVETSVKHREMEYEILPKITRDISENILELILSDWSVSL